jgi:hypothetical protein
LGGTDLLANYFLLNFLMIMALVSGAVDIAHGVDGRNRETPA